MRSKPAYTRLSFGPHVAVSFANLEDYGRYRINQPGHLQWGYQWIKERMLLSGTVGVLQHSNTGFSFDTYLPIPQVNPFHNVMTIPGAFFSDYYIKTRSEAIEDLSDQNYYSDICCPLQLHVLSDEELDVFVKKAVSALKNGGNLLLSFNLWLGCDAGSKDILRYSRVLRQNNKQVCHPLGFHCDTIMKYSEEMFLPDPTNKEVTALPESAMEDIFFGDCRIVSQHSRTVFKRNFPDEDQRYLQVAHSARSLAGCLWFKKCETKLEKTI